MMMNFTCVSFYQADPWVVSNHGFSFVWQAFFLSYENILKQLFNSNTDFWRNIFKNDEATFQFYRQTQIQQYEINNSTLNQFCAFSFFLLAAAAVVIPGILME
jgi:hypothetical protein